MKKILVIAGLCLLAGYLVFAAFYFQEKPKEGTCKKFDVVVENTDQDNSLINAAEIKQLVKNKKLDPSGKALKDINTNAIEEAILTNKLIKKAEVYITGDGSIKASVKERKPVLRIINNSGESYYIDDEGRKMPLSNRSVAYLPVATGAIKEDFARGDLYNFALFLSNDEFWDAQIEQIVVQQNNDVSLIPRVGDQQIVLGQLSGYKEKLQKLLTFYKKGLNEIGWNKYSVINLKYNKQVVCTKR